MSIHRRILASSWHIAWKNKYLWFFGLFASVSAGGGVFETLSNAFSGGTSRDLVEGIRTYSQTGIFSKNIFSNIIHIIMNDTLSFFIFLFLFLFLLLLLCFVVWLSMVSQAALVSTSAKIIGEKSSNFQDAVNSGISKFWPVFSMNVLFQVVSGVILLVVSAPMLFIESGAGQTVTNLIFALFFILFIPLVVVISFVIRYAICFAVVRGEKIKQSIQLAIAFFAKNWLISLEMAFILFAIGFLATFALILGVLVLAVPFAFLMFLAVQLELIFLFWVLLAVSLSLLFAIIVLFGSIFTSFQVAATTNLFIELLNRGGQSKLIRVFAKQ